MEGKWFGGTHLQQIACKLVYVFPENLSENIGQTFHQNSTHFMTNLYLCDKNCGKVELL